MPEVMGQVEKLNKDVSRKEGEKGGKKDNRKVLYSLPTGRMNVLWQGEEVPFPEGRRSVLTGVKKDKDALNELSKMGNDKACHCYRWETVIGYGPDRLEHFLSR